MKKWIILAAGVAALSSFAPASSFAQGVEIGVPGVAGVRIGEPGYHRHYDRHYGPRHERNVYLRGERCKTVTIERDDGSVKRIRRCD